ncbi:MAG TPA: DinB family protein [Pyrinomonadaceae bacterium]|nr:DinB family protein [Pyrinomonadaceae bacterium]
MESNVLNIVSDNFIVQALIREIGSGNAIIASLTESDYRSDEELAASIGGHFRHILDFVGTFLNGIAERRIDYTERERDVRVERDSRYAIERFEFAARRLRSITDEVSESMLLVRSEIDAGRWYASSVAREVEFVLSHTIHHHALIAEKLKCLGLSTPEGFGVSSSTLRYWTQQLAA